MAESKKNKSTGNEEKPKKVSKKEKEIDSQVLKIFLFLAGAVVIFFALYNLFSADNEVGTSFQYMGLNFTIVEIEGVKFYHYPYLFATPFGPQGYNLYLRIDPRENNIPIEGDKIIFPQNAVYIGIENDALSNCPSGVLASTSLASFLVGNRFTPKAGEVNALVAEERNQTWISCQSVPFNTVIEMRHGPETKVIVDGDCIQIIADSCEILEPTEKFILQVLLDAK